MPKSTELSSRRSQFPGRKVIPKQSSEPESESRESKEISPAHELLPRDHGQKSRETLDSAENMPKELDLEKNRKTLDASETKPKELDLRQKSRETPEAAENAPKELDLRQKSRETSDAAENAPNELDFRQKNKETSNVAENIPKELDLWQKSVKTSNAAENTPKELDHRQKSSNTSNAAENTSEELNKMSKEIIIIEEFSPRRRTHRERSKTLAAVEETPKELNMPPNESIRPRSSSEDDDPDELFLLSLHSHLKSVPEERKIFAKTELMQVLAKYSNPYPSHSTPFHAMAPPQDMASTSQNHPNPSIGSSAAPLQNQNFKTYIAPNYPLYTSAPNNSSALQSLEEWYRSVQFSLWQYEM